MKEHSDQRSSPRVPARIEVQVEGRDRAHKPFTETTSTLLINDGGALIALAAELDLNDRMNITNRQNGKSASCRVAWRSVAQLNGRWSYGVALIAAEGDFWEGPAPA
ncbi:MAG TPA: PilZ domain-containing protein [Candidatus Acidoferrales bacterium]|nr:PilZ domain-containing protein [Candidatus Acidoferrales bacterium]